jgi:hypothetical protein
MKAVMASSAIMSNLPVREARALFAGQEVFLVGFNVSAP